MQLNAALLSSYLIYNRQIIKLLVRLEVLAVLLLLLLLIVWPYVIE